uniref:A-kinase anchoring protein 10 n=1 Tax=Takifugu rubripes TaxID=31033 RepID=A0A674N763_TAKRU
MTNELSFFFPQPKAKNQRDLALNLPRTPSLGAKYQHGGQEVAGPSHVAISAISANMDSFARGRTATLKKQPSHIEATHFGDLGHSSVNYQPQEARSRLSKTVDHILRDNMAIPHFMHFTELRSIDHLVRFWLEAESFRSTSWSRIRAHSLNSVKHSTLAEPIFTSQDGSEVQEVIQPDGDAVEGGSCNMLVAQSKLRDSSTTETSPGPCTPQTDTPTSQPSSRTGTPYKTSSTTRDISGKLMKSIEKDAVTIFTRFISPDAVRPIPITEQIRNDIVAKICGEDGMVDPNCFVIAQTVVKAILEEQHFSEFLRSHHYCKYQIEVLTSGSVFLADILFCESALFYFSEYIEKEEAMNILQFWLAADNFQNQLAAKKGQYDGLEAQNDAMILYDKYFSLQATNPLGFGDSVRMEIESNICREGGPLPDCFITPLRQAWTTMEKVYLPGFLSSNLYYKYLSDLINSVRADEFMLVSAQGQTGQADNDRSSSTSSDGPVATIYLDPEQLYQRPYAGKMTFGKVNELGQFIRESEPEPDAKKSKGSVFSQAMKKWVQGSSDQAQEEMAWQIAKMIVNDVVSQSNHCSPVRSTKVHTLTAAHFNIYLACSFFNFTHNLHILIDVHESLHDCV